MFWELGYIIILLVSYIYLIRPHSHWRRKGVPQTNPVFLLGDIWKNILKLQLPADVTSEIYHQANGHRYFGFYQTLLPALLIKDPDLIKQITVKDFDHFQNHRIFVVDDPLWSNNLLSLKGQRWKEMRTTLSPSFTSSKMKVIFALITECAETLTNHFLSQKDEELKNLEMKDVFTRFANDVIASAAFGVKCDSLGDRNNTFYLMAREAVNFTSSRKVLRLSLMAFFPKLGKLLKVRVYDEEVATFFRDLVKKTIALREKEGIIRFDMIHLLMEARKKGMNTEEQDGNLDTGFATVQESDMGKPTKQTKFKLTDDDITAQGLIFFFAGFESVTSLMSFMAYELAVHPEIQQKLIREIDETRGSCEDNVTYEVLLRMKYMDMVVSESLRKWPVFITTDRIVTKPYIIQPIRPDEKPVHLDVGERLIISTNGLHHDPQHFPNPERFDPERFSDENKANVKPYSYLPFGSGPRSCIASRFALLETKAVFFYLLSNFELVASEKTEIPLTLNKKSFNLTAKNGYWLSLKRRNKHNL